MARSRLILALLASVITVTVASAQAQPVIAKPTLRSVDLVICLDCSGSMQGLIDSAKLKLWDVVNELATLKPTPTLRVALYSYGGQGADYPPTGGYTRKEIDLTTDLDAVYEKLNALKITGSVEYVTGVSKRAIGEQKWATGDTALKLLFVCGNEQADQDPTVKLVDLAKLTKETKVKVNTIYCGPKGDGIADGWKQVAEQCGGKAVNIDMNKAQQQVIATPFDKELNTLSTKLNGTYLFYGESRTVLSANQSKQDEYASKASPSAGASRATTKGGDLYRNDKDVIDKLKSDPKFDVNALKESELPEALKALKPEERTAYIKKQTAEREDIQKQIAELSTKRARHIDEERKKAPKEAGDQALDEALKATIREQAKASGFELPAKK